MSKIAILASFFLFFFFFLLDEVFYIKVTKQSNQTKHEKH